MADISNLYLYIFKKGQNDPAFKGDKGTGTAAITGLAPGTVVAKGDYQGAFSDGTNVSGKIDVDGFTVLSHVSIATVGTAVVGQSTI